MKLPEYYFYIVLFIIGGFIFLTLALLVLHFLMPKVVLERFFKQPHFTETELEFFTGFPFSPLRTLVFMTVMATPKKGLKRNISKVQSLTPMWYRISANFIVYGLYLLMTITLLGLAAYIFWKLLN